MYYKNYYNNNYYFKKLLQNIKTKNIIINILQKLF